MNRARFHKAAVLAIASVIGLAACSAVTDSTTGPATQVGIGVADLVVTDETRADIASPDQPRHWHVRIFYPACETAPEKQYADEMLLSALVSSEYYGQDEGTIRAWGDRTVGLDDARPCSEPVSFVTLSIGLGVAGINYSLLAEKLAHEGYAVAIIDHPYGAVAQLPDGSIQSSSDDPRLASIDADPAVLSQRIAEWTQDISHTISTAIADDLMEGLSIEENRLYAIGHSMGGAAALDACRNDDRLIACADMDGAPFGTRTMEEGGHGNLLILHANPRYSDEDLTARGRTREQWDAMGEQFEAVWTDTFAQGDADVTRISVAGTGHMSFSDAPFVMPDTILQFGGDILEAGRAHEVIVSALDAYMRDQSDPTGAFQTVLIETPELELQDQRHAATAAE